MSSPLRKHLSFLLWAFFAVILENMLVLELLDHDYLS